MHKKFVIRITLTEATKILIKHFEKEHGKPVYVDWMPHELNYQVNIKDKTKTDQKELVDKFTKIHQLKAGDKVELMDLPPKKQFPIFHKCLKIGMIGIIDLILIQDDVAPLWIRWGKNGYFNHHQSDVKKIRSENNG